MSKNKPATREWLVTIDISGVASVLVQAESEEEAMEIAKSGEYSHLELDSIDDFEPRKVMVNE